MSAWAQKPTLRASRSRSDYAPKREYLAFIRCVRDWTQSRLAPLAQPTVRRFDGRRALLDDLLGDGFALMGYAADPRARLDTSSVTALDAIGTCFVALYPLGGRPQGPGIARSTASGLIEVEDISGEGTAWLRQAGARPGHVAIVRPDKFVYALAPADEIPAAVMHLLRTIDRPQRAAEIPLAQLHSNQSHSAAYLDHSNTGRPPASRFRHARSSKKN